MKIKFICLLIALALLATLRFSTAFAQGTAFTYQGRLIDTNGPVSGNYDLIFSLFDTNSVGNQIGESITNSGVAVTNGRFITSLDFGSVFNGNPRWLEIGVRTNGASDFTTLSPRQRLTPTPYAITAGNALNAITITGPVPNAGLNGSYTNAVTIYNPYNFFGGSFTGNGSGLTNLAIPMQTTNNFISKGSSPFLSGVHFTNNNGIFLQFGPIGGPGTNMLSVYDNFFNGTPDPTMFWGYNHTLTGDIALTNETAASWNIEGNYNDGSGQNKMEAYLQWYGLPGEKTTYRPFFSQANKVTGSFVTQITGNPIQMDDISFTTNIANFYPTQILLNKNTILTDGNINEGLLLSNSGGTTELLLTVKAGSTGTPALETATASPLAIGTGGTPAIYINTSQHVGIGTLSPTTALQVVGTVNATAFSGDGSGLKNLSANAITGGFNTNIDIGGHTFYITNGIIMNVQ